MLKVHLSNFRVLFSSFSSLERRSSGAFALTLIFVFSVCFDTCKLRGISRDKTLTSFMELYLGNPAEILISLLQWEFRDLLVEADSLSVTYMVK